MKLRMDKALLACLSLLLLLAAADYVQALVRGGKTATGSDHADDGNHLGAFGGAVVPVGQRHAELVRRAGGELVLYALDRDPARIAPITATNLEAEVAGPDGAYSSVVLKPWDQTSDLPGTSSRFRGALPKELKAGPLTVALTLPLENGSYRARFDLGEAAAHNGSETAMPSPATGDKEQALYLTPGGVYTEADIAANGRITAAAKFQGVQSSHDMNPKSGDRICPITKTKANPRFSWRIGGKEYLFCCPPCVNEFVKRAKEQPGSIPPPESFIKE